MDYTKWENFSKVIGRAMIACENSGHKVSDDTRKSMVQYAMVGIYIRQLCSDKSRKNYVFLDEIQIVYPIINPNLTDRNTIEKNKDGKSVRKTNEVDFYAKRGTRSYYIQVTADISDEKTRNREVRPYILLNDQVQKILVINKPIKETRDKDGFTIIGIADFLLRFIK